MTEDEIKSLIKRRRHQMLIHSCIYYAMDENVISDDVWQKWANELAELQDTYPEYHKLKFFDREFVGWDGTSGAFLPLKNEWVWNKALYILDITKKQSTAPSVKNTVSFNDFFD